MVVALSRAFGPQDQNLFAKHPETIYNQLSQLSYHDRITLLREVFRYQHKNDVLERNHSDPEACVRIWLLNRLGRGTDGNPRFQGVTMFMNLVADAPQNDARYERMHNSEIRLVILEMPKDQFSDCRDPKNRMSRIMRTFISGSGVTTPGNPYQRLRSIGIIPGNPPLREDPLRPLGVVAAPVYRTAPAADSDARRDLVAQLVKAAGPVATGDETFIGFRNPNAFFRSMANYRYADRIALYRDVLRAQGLNKIANLPERNIRLHMMNRFRCNSEGDSTFAGVDRFFRLMSDAPRNTAHRDMLNYEIRYLMTDVDHTTFIDRKNLAVRDNYHRFYCVGAVNPLLLAADPYNRLELLGITFGRVPVLPAAPPVAPPRGALLDSPNLWDRLDTLADTNSPRRILDFSVPPETALCSLSPVNHPTSVNGLMVYSPLTIV